ncbi:MAG TPA: tRNA glutamyl-Q(34) synthetase GluQRS [Sphingomicrobium sp.]|nr:tRNA glutamyl-Q(34) synthetase GluQRS [Sphingomicrobium sp.]
MSRFAPSPTGRLHLGHAYSALLGHDLARRSGGRFLLRIEDLDRVRSRDEFVDGIFEDLCWLGLEWDDPVVVQSQRGAVYAAALGDLRERGLAYPCFCARSDIAAALEAPHGSVTRYPGTCRGLADDADRRAKLPHSWRLDVAKAIGIAGLPSWKEVGGRSFKSTSDDLDDVILARKDAPAAYHLACVVDDSQSGVTLVSRAADLRSSTPIQRLLQELFHLQEPIYLHHPLVAHADGRRLAKRDLAPTLAAMRESGVDGRDLRMNLAMGKLPLGFIFVGA